ncbi:MazG family protein [Haloglycomyces albus]|uniref:MazG family protein n=1 Tax=Haloglycomyces albus TaxID=526067 RepID=UPI0004ADD333|nr:MazG family protein [Haloglycomyces albus]
MTDIVLFRTSPRVSPGLYSAAAWKALHEAVRVAASFASETTKALVDAGIDVHTDAAVEPLRDGGVWIEQAGDESVVARFRAWQEAGRVTVTELHANWDRPGARVLDLVDTVDALHADIGGCPWHKGQTHTTLAPYLLEETHETLEAIDARSDADLREELGDLLFQPLLHARINSEFTLDDVADDVVEKIRRRHPHVFADAKPDDLYDNWAAIKGAEKSHRSRPDEGIPRDLPALAFAQKLLKRTDPHWAHGDHPDNRERAYSTEEIGQQLLELVDIARNNGVDAETALRRAVRRHSEGR